MGYEKSNHFEKIKKIFLDTMNKNKSILDLSNADLRSTILKDIGITTSISDIKQIRSILVEKCRNLAGFININSVEQIEIEQKFIGEYFCSSEFIVFTTHFSLIEYLYGNIPPFYKNVFGVLHNFLGNICYYLVDELILQKVFKYALFIFLLNPNDTVNKCLICEKVKRRCDAIKRISVDYEIEQDDVNFTKETLETIHKRLEDKIKDIDGFIFLQMLKEKALAPFYEKSLDRYRIHRHKGFGLRDEVAELPVNYLIQLAIKALKFGNFKKSRNILSEEKYKKIIRESQDFLTALNLVTNSIHEDINVDTIGLPKYLFDNMLYEALVIPEQYNIKFLIDIIKNMFYPFSVAFNNCKSTTYSLKAYIHVARKILESEEHFFSFSKLKKLTRVGKEELTNILRDMAIDVKIVNCDYNSIFEKTNSTDYPLIILEDGTYYFFDSRITGWAFYKNLYNRIKGNTVVENLNQKLGYHLEDYIKKLFKSKNISYVSGKYFLKKGQEEECDIIIESDEAICGIETKYCFLNKDFEIGDDVSLYATLGKGMIKAQYQLLKHRLDLLMNETLKLHSSIENKKFILRRNNRRILSISLCLPEYRFLTTKILAEKLLEMLLFCSINVRDELRKSELAPLYKVQKDIHALLSDKVDLFLPKERIFFDSMFLSSQQIYLTVKMCKNADAFIERIQNCISVHIGEMDYYELLLKFKN